MSQIKQVLIFSFTLLPLLLLIVFAIKYTVNIPFADEWYFVPLFEKMFNHTLTFKDLWAQHNEHRFLITKLITLANVQLTGWDLKYEIYLNVTLGIATFLTLLALLKRETTNFSKFSVYWIFPALSFLIFSLTQSENWLWGIQMNIFLNALFVLIGFTELTSSLGWKSVFFASALGILATYSNAGGLLYWPTALIIIYFHPRVLKNLKYKIIFYWVFITTIVTLSYFYNYKTPQYGLLPIGGPTQILAKFAYQTLAILGSALEIFSKKIATILGFSGLTIYTYLCTRLIKNRLQMSPLFLSQIALSLYAISNILITSTGRLKFGLTQEQLATRYGFTSELFWVAIIILIFLHVNLNAKGQKQKFKLSFNQIALSFIVITIVSILAVKSSLQGLHIGIERQIFLKNIEEKSVSNEYPNKKLLVLVQTYPLQTIDNLENVVDLRALIDALNILSKHNLSIFK